MSVYFFLFVIIIFMDKIIKGADMKNGFLSGAIAIGHLDGASVLYDSKGDPPAWCDLSTKKIHLPPINSSDISDELSVLIRGYVDHEVRHIRYSGTKEKRTCVKMVR